MHSFNWICYLSKFKLIRFHPILWSRLAESHLFKSRVRRRGGNANKPKTPHPALLILCREAIDRLCHRNVRTSRTAEGVTDERLNQIHSFITICNYWVTSRLTLTCLQDSWLQCWWWQKKDRSYSNSHGWLYITGVDSIHWSLCNQMGSKQEPRFSRLAVAVSDSN